MPTEKKVQMVEELKGHFERSTIAISTDFRGVLGAEMTDLRAKLREKKADYKVVKNTLAAIAAKEAGKAKLADLLKEDTGLIIGYGEPVDVAKAVDDYVKANRATKLVVRSALLGEAHVLTAAQLTDLAGMSPKAQLIAMLLGQMNAPITSLVWVLNGPVQGLATVLKRRGEQLEQQGGVAVAAAS